MSLWTSLEPASATVDPGGTTTVRLRLRNTGDVVDEYRFEAVGDTAPWTTVEPATLRLYPGTTGAVELTFAPPRTPDAAAGPHPYAVRVTPTEHPEAVTVPEGNLTITPFSEVRAELVPPTVKGRLRGRPRLAVDNLGNTTLTASVSGADNGDDLSYDLVPGHVQIEPGRAAFVRATLKPRQVIWFGSKQRRPYTLTVQRSGTAPLEVDGTYVQRGFLPGWLATSLGVALALAITIAMLWIAYKPQVRTAAVEQLQQAGVSTLPPPDAAKTDVADAPSPPGAEPTAEPPLEQAPEDPPRGDAGGGGGKKGGGSGDATTSPKAKKETGQRTVTNVLLRLRSVKRCADVPDVAEPQRGDLVTADTCDPGSGRNERWNIEVVQPKGGPGDTALFQIRQVKGGLCMDLNGLGAKPAASAVFTYGCNGTTGDNQLWWLDQQDEDTYWIRNFASHGSCLDMAGTSVRGNHDRLVIRDCVEGEAQRWQLVNPTAPQWTIVHP
ncbi:RICIN domain-containing protein [Streptomyces longwoodensis]|uniref:RICIN domain-containing protein n=1 Tax=Streptomyces longwoodensis TaxID=68231 RepID=UPI00099EEE08|nr:RICIN domain-containing protein [Streptomyces longwoodensis]